MTEPNRPARLRPAMLGLVLASFSLGALPAAAGLGPNFELVFSPATIGPESSARAVFTIENPTPLGATDFAFTTSLPAGVVVAEAPGLVTDCVNALAQASPGSPSISLSEGRLSAQSGCTVEVNVSPSAVGTYISGPVMLTSSLGSAVAASATLTVDAGLPAFSKAFSPSSIGWGERSTLTFTIDQTLIGGNTFNLSFQDRLPEGMSFASPTNTAIDCVGNLQVTPGGDIINLFSGFLTAGQICTISVDVVGQIVGELENASGTLASTRGTGGFATAALEVTGGELNLRKLFQPNPALPGEIVELHYTLQNTDRRFDAEQLTFSDDLGAAIPGAVAVGLPLVDPCGAGSTMTGAGIIALNGGRLPPDGSCSFSVDVQLPAALPPGDYPSQTSAVTGLVSGSPVAGSPAIETLIVNEGPTLTKTFLTAPVGAGGVATVEFTITNSSATETATSIQFSDALTEFISGSTLAPPGASGFCNGTGNAFVNNVAFVGDVLFVTGMSLAPGASCTFSLDLSIPANTPPGRYTNTTSEVSASTGTQPAASAEIEVVGAPFLTARFTDDPVLAGGLVTLEYTLSNPSEGALDIIEIAFNHDLDAALAGTSAVGLPQNDVCGIGSQIAGTSPVTLTGARLGPGASCTFSVTVQVPASALPGVYPAPTGAPTATSGGISVIGLAADATLDVAGLEFTKAFIDDPVLPGDQVILRYTLDNVGAGTFSGGFFTDSISSVISGLTVVGTPPIAPCGVGSSLSGTTFLIAVGLELAPGSSCSFDLTLQVPAAAVPDAYQSNTSVLNGQYDGAPISLPLASDVLAVEAISVPEFSKTFSDDPAQPGDAVTLEFTLTNPDPVEAMTNLSFSDDLDAVLFGLTATGLPAADVCGAGSALTGASVLTLTGGTLAAGTSCTFSVTLQVPAGAAPGEYINTTSIPTATVSGQLVSGLPATDRLQVTVLEASKSFSNPAVTGATTTLSYTLVNPGPTPLDALAFTDDLNAVLPGLTAVGLPFNDACGAGSSLSGSSLLVLNGAALAPGASCSFDVTIAVPGAALPGIYSSSTSAITSSGLAIGTPAVADLQVVGIPELIVMPATIDFGPLRVGTPSSPQAVTLENTGNDLLTITAIDPASGPFSRIGGSCPGLPIALAPSGSCTLTYGFAPVAVGPESLQIQIQSDDPASPDVFTLTGSGIESALVITPNPLDFGPIRVGTTSTSRLATVSNPGTASLNVTAIDPAAVPFSSGTGSCGAAPFSVPPGASCTLAYEASPIAAGPASTALTLVSDAPDSPSTLNLTVTGTESALLLSPGPLDFGDVGIGTDSPVESITVSNPGTAELNVSALDAPTAPFSAAGGSCGSTPFSLAPGASCTLDYRVSPLVVGPAQNDLQLTSDAPSSPDALALRANGTPPSIALFPDPLDFGDVGIDTTSSSLSVTVSNPSAAVLDVSALESPAPPFAAAGGSCGSAPFQIDPGASCELAYTFAPTTVGPIQVELQLTSNAPSSPDSLFLEGNGAPPALALDTTLLEFGPVPIQTNSERSVLLTNTAAGTLVIDALLPPASPFALDTGSCGALPITLLAGQSCSLQVRFTPEAILAYASTFEIESNDPDSPVTVEVRGFGQPLAIPALSTIGLTLLLLWIGAIGIRALGTPPR